jgi:hypothetical protein
MTFVAPQLVQYDFSPVADYNSLVALHRNGLNFGILHLTTRDGADATVEVKIPDQENYSIDLHDQEQTVEFTAPNGQAYAWLLILRVPILRVTNTASMAPCIGSSHVLAAFDLSTPNRTLKIFDAQLAGDLDALDVVMISAFVYFKSYLS